MSPSTDVLVPADSVAEPGRPAASGRPADSGYPAGAGRPVEPGRPVEMTRATEPVRDPHPRLPWRDRPDDAVLDDAASEELGPAETGPTPGDRPEAGAASVEFDAGWRLPEAIVGWSAAGRPVPRLSAESAAMLRDQARPARKTPSTEPVDPIVARLLEDTVATAAGRFLEPDLAGPMGAMLAPAGMFTVHLGIDSTGFQIDAHPAPPALLARLIHACPEWRGRPLLLIPHPQPAPNRLAALIRALLDDLGVPVYTADAGVLLLSGAAITGASFLRWGVPARGRGAAPVAVGPWLPHGGLPAAHGGEAEAVPVRGAVPVAGVRPVPEAEATTLAQPVPLPAVLALPTAGGPSAPGPMPVAVRRVLPTVTPRSPLVPTVRVPESPIPASPIPGSPRPASPRPGVAPPASAAGGSPQPAPSQDADRAAPVLHPDIGAQPVSRWYQRVPRGEAPVVSSPATLGSGADRVAPHRPDLAAAVLRSGPGGAPPPREPSGVPSVNGAGRVQGAVRVAVPTTADSRVADGRVGRPGRGVAGLAQNLRPWLAVRPRVAVEDRERLRTLLGWRYETHARAVMSALALQPGLRAGTGTNDLLAGLVAVRAYLSAAGRPDATGRSVDAVLRGAERRPDEDGLVLLARCIQAGLGRLPAVVGPVFRSAAPSPGLVGHHRPGDVLVEPAFLAVSTAPMELPGPTVEYVIWSSTARRTTWLGADAAPGGSSSDALFVAGTRFVVLAVDAVDGVPGAFGGPRGPSAERGRPGADETPTRVLLHEVVGGRVDAAMGERALGRLRDILAGRPPAASGAGAPGGPDGALSERLRFAIGVGEDGRSFAPDGARPADAPEPVATT